MRRISRSTNIFVFGGEILKLRRIRVLIGAFLIMTIIATFSNEFQLTSIPLSLTKQVDNKTSDFRLHHTTNIRFIEGLYQDNLTNYGNAKEKIKNETPRTKYSVRTSRTLASRLVAVDRSLNAIIDDIFQSEGSTALHFLDELWRRAGDLQAPDEALIALHQIAMSDDNQIAEKAQFALNDLIKYQSTIENEKQQELMRLNQLYSQNESPVKISNDYRQPSVENKYAQVLEDVESMLYSNDEKKRTIAIDTLNVLRTPAALSLLLQVANQEFDFTMRYKAITGIWMYAADGVQVANDVSNNTAGIDALYQATYDQNLRIATLARTALGDLNKR